MSIRDAQRQVDRWIDSTGAGYYSELTNTAVLMEEVGELARVMSRQYGDQRWKESDRSRRLDEEMADILFVLLALANQTGVDLETAFQQKMKERSQRDRDPNET